MGTCSNHTGMKFNVSKYFGPSTLVTAAFIGPGTVTVCTLAGVHTGYTLLWTLVFSVFATIVLQEMTARIGLITQKGFGEAIRREFQHPVLRWAAVIMVMGAIVIGNAAYEGGNISGAVLGFEELFFGMRVHTGTISFTVVPLMVGFIAFILLFIGRFKVIEYFLIGLVFILSVVFLTTAVVVRPNLGELLTGVLVPTFSGDQLLLVMGLIGTTVVPYNLFLHAALVKEKYTHADELADLRKENATSIIIGGIISMSIIITSAATLFGTEEITNAADMAGQLTPLLGNWAGYFLGTGLFAAGISSAITAPLAAAYAVKGILGWESDLKSTRFRLVWICVLLLGTASSMFGISPVVIIKFAQVANGILLPMVAVFLVVLVNKKNLMGEHINSLFQNILAGMVLIVAFLLGFKSIYAVFDYL